MGKYFSSTESVFSVFASDAWKAEGIPAVPVGAELVPSPDEWIRLDLVLGDHGTNTVSTRGQLVIDIFTPYGNGPMRASQIADILDAHLACQSVHLVGGVAQFGASTMAFMGRDKANQALSWSQYAVNFNFFGEQ